MPEGEAIIHVVMRDFILTAHAEAVVAERGIAVEWIAVTLSEPESVIVDRDDLELSHALRRIPEFGGRTLRVVFNQTSVPKRVVTAYFDRALKG
jgi:hypothetical protein